MVDGPNLYAYVRGNPVRLVDPSGMEGEDVNDNSSQRRFTDIQLDNVTPDLEELNEELRASGNNPFIERGPSEAETDEWDVKGGELKGRYNEQSNTIILPAETYDALFSEPPLTREQLTTLFHEVGHAILTQRRLDEHSHLFAEGMTRSEQLDSTRYYQVVTMTKEEYVNERLRDEIEAQRIGELISSGQMLQRELERGTDPKLVERLWQSRHEDAQRTAERWLDSHFRRGYYVQKYGGSWEANRLHIAVTLSQSLYSTGSLTGQNFARHFFLPLVIRRVNLLHGGARSVEEQ